jgi:hypothetical protein
MPGLPEQVAQGEKLQTTALSKDTETSKVSVATKLSRNLTDNKTTQARIDSVPPPDVSFHARPAANGESQALDRGRSSPFLSPSRLVRAATVQDDEQDGNDDNWQPLPQDRDEPPRPTKRRYLCLSPGNNTAFEVPPEPPSSRPKKKARLSSTAAQKEAIVTKETTPERKKRRVDEDAKYANRMIAVEQRRFTNPTNRHVKAMGRWNFVKV